QRQQTGLGGQGPRNFQAALIAIAEGVSGLACARRQADEIKQRQGMTADLGLFPLEGRAAPHRMPPAHLAAHMPAHPHVVEHRHGGKQADVLEGARNAGGRHLVHQLGLVRTPGQHETPVVGRHQAGDHIEEGGLASAIGADQAVDLARVDAQTHLAEGLHAAEALGHPADLQQLGRLAAPRCTGPHPKPAHALLPAAEGEALSCRGAGHRPRGRLSMMPIMARAIMSWRRMAGSRRPSVMACKGVATWRSTSGKAASRKAPRMTPGTCPSPPSTTMATISTDSCKVKDSGETKPWKLANSTPPTPPKAAPRPKASSLRLRVFKPMALAASSSSRMAIQARPRRESCKRRLMMTATTTRARKT